ncbi:MAG: hypothetical protein ACRELB_25560 [Polyangiaceae bacterium]
MTAAQVIARAMPTVRILWAALTASNVVFAALSFVLVSGASRPPPDVTVLGIGLAALVAAVASFVLPLRVRGGRTATLAEPEPSAVGARGPARFVDPAKAARQAIARGQTGFIVSMALSESISCDGLALHMIGAPHSSTLPFFVVGTALCLVRFPTRARLLGPYERLHGATFAASEPGSY